MRQKQPGKQTTLSKSSLPKNKISIDTEDETPNKSKRYQSHQLVSNLIIKKDDSHDKSEKLISPLLENKKALEVSNFSKGRKSNYALNTTNLNGDAKYTAMHPSNKEKAPIKAFVVKTEPLSQRIDKDSGMGIKSNIKPSGNKESANTEVNVKKIPPIQQGKDNAKGTQNRSVSVPSKKGGNVTIGNNNDICHAEFSQTGTKDNGEQKKNNQDSYIMVENVFQIKRHTIFGVMDGHGPDGHMMSSYVKNAVQSYFTNKSTIMKKTKDKDVNEASVYSKLKNKEYKIFKDFYRDLDEKLKNAEFEIHYSGTTCVIVHLIGNKLICTNIGDSRAILVTKDSDNYTINQISLDHKPDNPKEKARIISKGGEIHPCNEDIEKGGPMRVWAKGEKYPGIAVSRTLGDQIAKTIGIISQPDIVELEMKGNECFIVVGSDGIWEYLSNDLVKKTVLPFYLKNDPKGAAGALVIEATNKWKEKGKSVDDITCIVYFFKNPKDKRRRGY